MLLLKYKDFSRFHDEVVRNQKTPRHTAVKIFYYVLAVPIWFFFLTALASIVSEHRTSKKTKYPSDRYRKVIKEGILWDDVEYHER